MHRRGRTPLTIRIGHTYGGWRVLSTAPRISETDRSRRYRVLCLRCRKTIRVSAASRIQGQLTSCCNPCASKARKTHGMTKSITYQRWQDMLRRVGLYGGRPAPGYEGVPVCRRWHRFDGFLRDMGVCQPGLTLGRLNPRKGYSKRNCAWQTWPQQARAKRSNRWYSVCGYRFLPVDLGTIIGAHVDSMIRRLRRYPALQAFTMPLKMSYSRGHKARRSCYCRVCDRTRAARCFYCYIDRYGRPRYSWLCKSCVLPTLKKFHRQFYGVTQ